MRAVTSSPVPLARWRTNKAPISVPVSCLYRPPLWPHVSWCPPAEAEIYDGGKRKAIADLLHYTYKHQHEEQSTEQRTKGQKLE